MNGELASVEKVAEVVLYEGYLLYPYRPSAMKNQQRWTFGGVYPRRYSEASAGDDPWVMQTQCLVLGDETATIEVKVRFLQVADRRVLGEAGGVLRPMDELRLGDQVYRPWEEAIEREIVLGGHEERLSLESLVRRPRSAPIDITAGSEEEPLTDPAGQKAGGLVREWQGLQGAVELVSERLDNLPAYRLTVRIVNATPLPEPLPPRTEVLRQTFISTHTIIRVAEGEFVSLLEPPDECRDAAASCENLKTWPVLAGSPGERHTMLSSPIILYDYPQIAPESPGNYYDTTEIDELLALSVMTLTDEEKQEMRESDPRAREILERTESLSPEQLMKLHGAIRSLEPVRKEES